MLVSESWLRQMASPKISSEDLAERLTLAGLEVDSVSTAGPKLDPDKIVVGAVIDIQPHPNAKKLKLCKVDIGKSRAVNIICGAGNVYVGMKTAVALNGAKLPGIQIQNREIRGIKSQGMLCSATELALEETSTGILEFDPDTRIGTAVCEYMNLADTVYQLELTPNRGDCLGMTGIAREVATLTRSKFSSAEITKVRNVSKTKLSVQLQAAESCPRYVGRAIMGIDMQARTPDWMREKLRRSGLRSINVIVDITNYVMHELGQPMHAFDFDRISGGIRVRMAKIGEKLKLLDGSNVKLKQTNLVIADHKKAIALAGIMGGDNSAISSHTENIYLEAAFFAPDAILGKAREFGMHTDASHRFERGVDYTLQQQAMERATQLVVEIAGGEAGPVTHAVNKGKLPKSPSFTFNQTEISRLLGVSVPIRRVNRIMQDLGIKARRNDLGWRVTPPPWRFDISGQHDMVEEIGRCHGFEHIAAKMPAVQHNQGFHLEKELSQYQIKTLLADRGYNEAITYSFVDPTVQCSLMGKSNAIKLANPISDNMSVMRQSLWPGLLDALVTNLNRQESRVRLFEIGHVFNKAKNSRKSNEVNRLAGLISGTVEPLQWGLDSREADFFDLKGDLEAVLNLTENRDRFEFKSSQHSALHPGQCATILFNKKAVGLIGRLHPVQQKAMDIAQSTYLFEIDMDCLQYSPIPSFSEISKYPSLQRDLALLVDQDIEVHQIFNEIRDSGGKLLKKLELFDIYQGKNIEKNRKSLAFSLTFQSESSNLTSLEVDVLITKIIGDLNLKLGVQLRE